MRRLAKDRRGIADEVLPELAGRFRHLRRRPEPHQPLLESLRLEAACKRLLDHEDHPVAASAQHLPDPDAVVRRAIGAFGKEDDRLAHAPPSPSSLSGLCSRAAESGVGGVARNGTPAGDDGTVTIWIDGAAREATGPARTLRSPVTGRRARGDPRRRRPGGRRGRRGRRPGQARRLGGHDTGRARGDPPREQRSSSSFTLTS